MAARTAFTLKLRVGVAQSDDEFVLATSVLEARGVQCLPTSRVFRDAGNLQ